ncbi:hypothetical protein B296_00009647 [Ensete ventricosum]|uniref:Uncharacterized protein n=1 Tax=Ensete ventricosum TaxID=4639 RepID=A0A427B7N6_ENSVE|nr:hypothetical protein B296_00009647 [Ensete ventricosum]
MGEERRKNRKQWQAAARRSNTMEQQHSCRCSRRRSASWGSVVEWRGGGPSLLRRPRPRPPLADRELIERRRAVPTVSCECEGVHPSSSRDGTTKGASAQPGNGEGTRPVIGEDVVQGPLM